MAASAGDLHVKLSADIAEFRADMNRARDEMFKMQTAAVAAGTAIGEFVVRGADAAVRFVQQTIAMRANLDDLADATGESVQNLDGLRRAAEISGVEFGRTQAGLLKFTKSLNESGAEAKASTQALQAIGLSVEELRARRPAEAMLDVAKALAQFEDGAGKVSVATALMDKEGAAMLPFLKDLAEQGELNGKITAQQAAEAEKLLVEWRRMKQEIQDVAGVLASPLISTFANWLEQLREGKRIMGSYWSGFLDLGGANPFKSAGENINDLIADLESLKRSRDNTRATPGYGSYANTFDAEIKQLEKRIEFHKVLQRQEMRGPAADPQSPYFEFAGGQRPALPFRPEPAGGAGREARDPYAAELKRLQVAQAALESERNEFAMMHAKLTEDPALRALGADQKQELLRAAARNEELKQTKALNADIAREIERAVQASDQARAVELDRLSILGQRSETEYLLAQQREMDERDTLTRNLALEQMRLNKELEKQNDIGRDLGMTFKSAFEDAIVNGRRFSEVLKGIGQDIARIIVRKSITDPLFKAVSEGAGGLFKDLFRAEGGPVTGGQPYIVGERGPELIVPGMSGTVIPNHALNAMPVNVGAARSEPTSQVTINADLRGPDVAAVERLERFVAKMNATLERRAVAAVANAGVRGRSFG